MSGLEKMGLEGADLGVEMQVRNHNASPLSLGALPYQVALQGSPLASGTLQAKRLPAEAQGARLVVSI